MRAHRINYAYLLLLERSDNSPDLRHLNDIRTPGKTLVAASGPLTWNITRRCPLGILGEIRIFSRRSRDQLAIELNQLIQSLESGTGAGHFLLHLSDALGNDLRSKSDEESTPYHTQSSRE